MYEIAKHEFLRWLSIYKESHQLSSYEIKVLNIILNNFEQVASKGTASGSRANYLVAKIAENDYLPDNNSLISIDSDTISNDKIQHLQRLEIESFRGFSTFLKFDFSKQYSTFYGANGSGKSSLCEALEYCILGTVQEATIRRISLDNFLKNKKNNTFIKPVLKGLINEQEIDFQSDLESYKFSFIEKNRIDSFSHINATTPSEKSERLAALFGLSEFTDFVKGFTDSLENKIAQDTTNSQLLEKKEEANEMNKNSLLEKEKKVTELNNQIRSQIQEIKNPLIKGLEESIDFLQTEDGKGKISELENLSKINQKTMYGIDFFTDFPSKYEKCATDFQNLCVAEEKLISLSVNINMVAIYEAVSKLSNDIDHSICPVCRTPIIQTVVNPFDNAKQELENLSTFTDLKKTIQDGHRTMRISVKELNDLIIDNRDMLNILNYFPDKLILPIPDDINDFSKQELKDRIRKVFKEFDSIQLNIEKDKASIIKINKEAETYNSTNEYTVEAIRLRKIYNNLVELKGSLNTLEKEIKDSNKALEDFKVEREVIIKKVEKERQVNIHKQEFKNTYKKILISLINYQKELPTKMSVNLSAKIKEYYNTMNAGDADFEVIEELKMPISSSDSITIKFKDGIEENALQILSEGHVKLLGLAILLAKATDTCQNFIILDDIVNAIDDDHRSGVAKLLFENEDFKNTQIILTCHSESFIKKIEDCVPRKEREKKITRYVFLTPTAEKFRGIVVDYSNPKEPLELAEKDLERNALKDAAQKCRQAAESLINKLWKKLSSTYKIQISVGLSSPKSIPEFSSIIDGIIKQMKQFKNDTDPILTDLQNLKSEHKWYLLNKGAHYEDDQFQFEYNDVKELYDLLVKTEDDINSLDIKKLSY